MKGRARIGFSVSVVQAVPSLCLDLPLQETSEKMCERGVLDSRFAVRVWPRSAAPSSGSAARPVLSNAWIFVCLTNSKTQKLKVAEFFAHHMQCSGERWHVDCAAPLYMAPRAQLLWPLWALAQVVHGKPAISKTWPMHKAVI